MHFMNPTLRQVGVSPDCWVPGFRTGWSKSDRNEWIMDARRAQLGVTCHGNDLQTWCPQISIPWTVFEDTWVMLGLSAGSIVPGTPIIVWAQLLAEQIGVLLIIKTPSSEPGSRSWGRDQAHTLNSQQKLRDLDLLQMWGSLWLRNNTFVLGAEKLSIQHASKWGKPENCAETAKAEAKRRRPCQLSVHQEPAASLETTGKEKEGLSTGETRGDLLLLLLNSNYKNHKHTQKSPLTDHPEITTFNT